MDKTSASRRDFMRVSGAAVLASAASSVMRAPAVLGKKNDLLRVGLIGCGSRGNGAARQALLADPDTKLVALGDAFSDVVEDSYRKFTQSGVSERVDVPPERRFSGFDAYKGVIEHSDVVVLATPPGFRPIHIRAAVDALKHVFCEKPVAVDAAGVRSVLDTCRRAREKGLNVVSGLCYRYEFRKKETMMRIHDGAIGEIVAMETVYNTTGLWHRGRNPEWSEMEYQIRNWLYFDWLSGDHIVEQHIHSLDKLAWAMGDEYPVKATASGGRIVRTDPKFGNVYDHFNTTYEWANGVKGFSSCRQWDNSSTNVSDHLFGTKGKADIQRGIIVTRKGKKWRYRGEGVDDMYQNEHNALFAAIRKGDLLDNGEYMCKSTMMAIMARMSAYTGRTLTWDEALESQVELAPPAYEWGDLPLRPVPQPGKTESV